jgi:hypothetical protein
LASQPPLGKPPALPQRGGGILLMFPVLDELDNASILKNRPPAIDKPLISRLCLKGHASKPGHFCTTISRQLKAGIWKI